MSSFHPSFIRKSAILFFAILISVPTVYAIDSEKIAEDVVRESIKEKFGTQTTREGVSPKNGWGDFDVVEEREDVPAWERIALWLPNRFLDLVDIFRVDVGAGMSFGAVARITKYGQVGYRMMTPTSLRVGDLGRDYPFMMETSNEFGVGPFYVNSKDRDICKGEIGVGADVFIGAYAGICVEEIVDFVAGIFFLDVMDDDLE